MWCHCAPEWPRREITEGPLMSSSPRTVVIGAGSWGTAIASMIAAKHPGTTIWCWEPEVAEAINRRHENTLFLPDIALDRSLVAVTDLAEAVAGREIVIAATPAQHLRATLSAARPAIRSDAWIVIAAKGIEKETLKLMHEVTTDTVSDAVHRTFVLSGPTFAREIGMKMPSAAVIAGHNEESLRVIQELFSTPYFRLYRSTDLIGVEVGGAIKNVIAIGVGIVEGMRLGRNSQAALMTRAIAEMTRFAVKLGANPFTISGLSGLGDLILTCTGDLSRNRQVGIRLGRGEKLTEIMRDMRMVAEGVHTAVAAYQLAKKHEVAMPIVETVYRILYEDLDLREAIGLLMSRSLKEEIYGYGS